MFVLGTKVKDTVTGLKGRLEHLIIRGDGSRMYTFQPGSLDPETGNPVERIFITPDRIKGLEEPDPAMPLEILGTEAEDPVTGFKGTVTSLVVHLNGCVHASLQPKGMAPKGDIPRQAQEFDIRILKGPNIPWLTPTQVKASQKANPSPIPLPKGASATRKNILV